ncbi:MAG TPA: dihydrofolate reductase family protein [Solirubrobacterales bacterium]|jgi:dihydrofolate reductase|nr:dihydrofolate reductase family protein [Solirubrobacterales bacterium]
MGKLVEMTHVSLGGQIDELDQWAFPFLDDDHNRYASKLLDEADALLLGRISYQGMADAYLKMAEQAPPGTPSEFIDRMNSVPKYVASRTGAETPIWNATRLDGDVAEAVARLKADGMNLVKYGTGTLDRTLIEHGLIDEFHLSLTPVATGRGERLFEHLEGAPRLELQELTRFDSGVLLLVYTPR